MSHKAVFEAMDNSLRDMAKPEAEGGFGPPYDPMCAQTHPQFRPFGGKTVVLAGHWAQVRTCLVLVCQHAG